MGKTIGILAIVAVLFSSCNNKPESSFEERMAMVVLRHYGVDTVNHEMISVIMTMDSVDGISSQIYSFITHDIQPLPDTTQFTGPMEQEVKKRNFQKILAANEEYRLLGIQIIAAQKALSHSSTIYQNKHLVAVLPTGFLEYLITKQKLYETVETWKAGNRDVANISQ